MTWVSRAVLVVMGVATSAFLHGTTPRAPAARSADFAPTTEAILRGVARRIDDLDSEFLDLQRIAMLEVAPLARVLVEQYGTPPALARRIAVALVREGRRSRIDARLLLAVLLVENPWIDPQARSAMGAVGLMQVMPYHAGAWGCSAADLTDLDANICHGSSILAHAIASTGGDLDRALLRYNGCVLGTNTPDCHRYPTWVRSRLPYGWVDDVAARGGPAEPPEPE